MKKRKILLQHKILAGYIILSIVITGMVSILFHECSRVAKIESEALAIRQVRNDANAILYHISILASYGETVSSWTDEDYVKYQKIRLHIDSLLYMMPDEEFVSKDQTDTLRSLLKIKETHLLRIMQLFRKRDEADSLLLQRLPIAVRQATLFRTVTRKKKGISGLFGAKETVLLPPETNTLQSLKEEFLTIQEERQKDIESYADSLRNYNKELNWELRTLIATMEKQFQDVLSAKERYLKDSHDRSTLVITSLVLFAILLLSVSYLIILRDIRIREKDRKYLEELVSQNTVLLEMRKNIILTLSHDIRTPLNIITGNVELAMDTREKKQRNIYLKNIGDVCLHVVHLLNNLLDVYLLNEANEKRKDVPFNLHEMLERTAMGFSRMANNKGIRFVSDFKNTEVRLYGDAVRIEQIMDNLLANAVKFTESGTISFHVCYHEGKLTLEIEDTGSGMTEETLSRIFRPFERKDSAANADGHGLGLSITQGLVKLLDGNIEVKSSIEQGSMFRVTLPLRQTDEPVENENPVQPHFEHLPRRVLVIDDNNMLRDVVKKMLERNGIACTACSTVTEVVKAMRSMDYDLLLSDIQMPGTNGFDLLALLRNSNIGNSRTIPVVAMTARGDNRKEDYLKAGFADCIYKPFLLPDLLNLLSTIRKYRENENRKVDFNTMLAEVNDKAELLGSFIEQSRQDANELTSSMNGNDRKRLREIAHRMQPMWELLQMGEILSDYRTLLKDTTTDDDIVQKHTQQIITCTAMLIAEAENEIKKLENETENTDC